MTTENLKTANILSDRIKKMESYLSVFNNNTNGDKSFDLFYLAFFGQINERNIKSTIRVKTNNDTKKVVLKYEADSSGDIDFLSDKSKNRIIKMYEIFECVVKDCIESDLDKLNQEFNKL